MNRSQKGSYMLKAGRRSPGALMKSSSAVLFSLVLLTTLVCTGQTPHPAPGTTHKQTTTAASTGEAIHLNNLGVAYMNQQQFARALRLFRQAAALNPKLDIAKTNEGIALANLQKYVAAAARLNALVKKDPGNAHAWYTLGLVYKNQTESHKSLAAFEAAARLVPNDADVFYFIGVAQSEMDRYDDAIAAFQHALELNPFHASAAFGLARALTVAGAAQPSSAAIPLLFSDITHDSGLTFSSPGSGRGSGADQDGTGAGACFLDFDNDGHPDLLLADGG